MLSKYPRSTSKSNNANHNSVICCTKMNRQNNNNAIRLNESEMRGTQLLSTNTSYNVLTTTFIDATVNRMFFKKKLMS